MILKKRRKGKKKATNAESVAKLAGCGWDSFKHSFIIKGGSAETACAWRDARLKPKEKSFQKRVDHREVLVLMRANIQTSENDPNQACSTGATAGI